jgi:putative membrane protein
MRHALALVLLCAAACTPEATQHALPKHAVEAAPSASLASQDRDFLERAAEANNAEIAIGGLVDGRAASGDVVAFGHMLVADHTAAKNELTAIAAAKHITPPTDLGESQASFDKLVDQQLEPFDHTFARTMVDDHAQAAELYRNEAAGGADPQLKAYAARTLPVIEAHLAKAKTLPGANVP